MTRTVMWFRRDLRLADNPAWAAATNNSDRVTCLFVIDPMLWKRAHPRRRAMLAGHLAALDGGLRELGGRLRIEYGDPADVVPTVAGETRSETVHVNADVTPFATSRDLKVGLRVPVAAEWGNYLHPIGSITTSSGAPFRVFTPFHKVWASRVVGPSPKSGPAAVADLPGAKVPGTGLPPMEPGERAAWERLESLEQRVDRYVDERDRPDLDGTSRLSTDLKFGTIAPARVVRVVGDASPGRIGFLRQLAWREFYAQLLLAEPSSVDSPLRPEFLHLIWEQDPDGLEAWKAGRTGFPIVDAGMRQLVETGWIHNRVRLLTASFLVKDLLTDWRLGERFFRHHLLDADTAQNIGNWQWVAGTGSDPAPYFRIFNPVAQSRKFDPDGTYIRRWVPELAGLDHKDIHAPWEAPPLTLADGGVELGVNYPWPIVDHPIRREMALAAYGKARAAAVDSR